MADSDLTLAATVATELGVASNDARLPRLIAAASAAICGYLDRKRLHYAAAYEEAVAGYGTQRLLLSLTPIVDVDSVEYAGATLDASTYSVEDAEAGILFRESLWPWTGRLRGGLPPQGDRDAGSEAATIKATYDGGWVTPAQAATQGWAGPARSLPYDIEEACVQTVAGLYRRGGADPLIQSESLGDYSVSYRGIGAGGIIPDHVLSILDRYKR